MPKRSARPVESRIAGSGRIVGDWEVTPVFSFLGYFPMAGYTTGIGEIILKLRIPNKMRVLILNATKRARVQHQRELLLGNLRLSINAQGIDICFCVHRLSVDCWRHGFAHSAK